MKKVIVKYNIPIKIVGIAKTKEVSMNYKIYGSDNLNEKLSDINSIKYGSAIITINGHVHNNSDEDILKITYVKKIDIDRKEIVVVIKAPNEVINVLSEKFEIVEEQKETIVVNSNKEEEIHVRQVSPFVRLVKLLCLALCIIFIIFGFNINKDTTIFGLYINGNKYAPFIISFVFGVIFIILSLPKDNKNVKE